MTCVRSTFIALMAAALFAVCPRLYANPASLQGVSGAGLSSPDGSIVVELSNDGSLGYTVKKDGQVVYSLSNISIVVCTVFPLKSTDLPNGVIWICRFSL